MHTTVKMNPKTCIQMQPHEGDVSFEPNTALKEEIKIEIRLKDKTIMYLKIEEAHASKLNCEWLLTQVKLKFWPESATRIVGLKTVPTSLSLDYWLSMLKKTLEVLPNQLVLEPIIARAREAKRKVSLQDFEVCGLLGKGGFSHVYLVRYRQDGKFYAMKQTRKDRYPNIKTLMKERNNMVKVQSLELAKLHFAFQTLQFCYLVMEFYPGGDLGKLIADIGPLSEDEAKYYVFQAVKGLQLLHANNIVFRDLKPENLLLHMDGHINFGDFGLSKALSSSGILNYSVCGTPEFWAPEVLRRQGYSFSVDYYNLGTLTYKLVTGFPPFGYKWRNENLANDVLYKRPLIPPDFSKPLQDFLLRTLEKDPSLRLGSKGIDEILSHPWFQNVRRIPPLEFSPLKFDQIVQKCTPQIETDIFVHLGKHYNLEFKDQSHYVEDYSFDATEIQSDLDGYSGPSKSDSGDGKGLEISKDPSSTATFSESEITVENHLEQISIKPKAKSAKNDQAQDNLPTPRCMEEELVEENFRRHSSLAKYHLSQNIKLMKKGNKFCGILSPQKSE